VRKKKTIDEECNEPGNSDNFDNEKKRPGCNVTIHTPFSGTVSKIRHMSWTDSVPNLLNKLMKYDK
jgi:hypothetical protein